MSLHDLNVEIMRLTVSGLEQAHVALELRITPDQVRKILTRDKARIRDEPRAKDCLLMYKDGHTLIDIGNKYKVTRERVRQIIKKQVGYEMGFGPLEQEVRKEELDVAARSVVDISREDRKGATVEEKLSVAEAKGIEAKYFDSVRKYCLAIGVTAPNLKKTAPEIYSIVKQNENRRVSRWSWYYDQCKACGTTKIRHQGYGYCEKCYPKSPEFKSIVQRSNFKNRKSRLEANKRYGEIYRNRPEVIERLEREYDEKYFGGNRKLVLERDGYKCITCGMKTDVKYKSGKPKVKVWHLDGTKGNILENLGTYDQVCFYSKYGSPRQALPKRYLLGN